MARQQFADVPIKGVRGGHITETEEVIDRLRVDAQRPRRKLPQGAQFRGEGESAGFAQAIERLDANSVAGQHQAALAMVPQREGKHSAQIFQQAGPVLFIEMQDNFRVRGGAELVPRVELLAEIAIVVDLAVKGDREAAVLVRERLVAAGKVDDAQPAVRDSKIAVEVKSFVVRPAMRHAVRRTLQLGLLDRFAGPEIKYPADSAHSGFQV